ncbi:type IV secretion system protein [Ralstonia chuxiongensis]|uniref:Type IV secretion system protein n=1 Tax=Ralstonia chuxiongensis TaxID=2957504 RepID=A0AA41WZC1_9RALS|nr:type IV secretion system protein [Ralstonia chuxiongensis]MCP1175674.1 type IV secretion system protein [Ralstonia chuxiongensis]
MFKLIKNKLQGGSAAGAITMPQVDDLELGKWYLEQTKQLAKSRVESRDRITDVAVGAVKWMGAITIVAVAGMATVVVVKRPNPPPVLRVDNATGKVDVLPTAADGKVSFTEKEDRADLRKYVERREGYDWETIQDMHDAVKAMSSEQEGELYDNFIRGDHSPLKVLKADARVIPKVGAISFVGSTAQVMFSRKYVPLNAAIKPETTYWVATITYRHDNIPEKRELQDINPTGWKATSYTVTRDWSRSGEDTGTQQGGQQ